MDVPRVDLMNKYHPEFGGQLEQGEFAMFREIPIGNYFHDDWGNIYQKMSDSTYCSLALAGEKRWTAVDCPVYDLGSILTVKDS